MAGLQSILDLRAKVDTVNTGLSTGTYIREIIEDNEVTTYIIECNTDKQLYDEGINSLGISIMDYRPYTPYTIELKKIKGQPTDRVTLRDTGAFEHSFFLDVTNDNIEIKANDFKTEELMQKYGDEILGLTDDNIDSLVKRYIYPELLKKIKQILYGTK